MRGFWLSLLVGFNVLAGVTFFAGLNERAGTPFVGDWIVGYVIFATIGNLILWFPYKAADKRCQAAKQNQEFASSTRACPHCREAMQREASVCPHCQRDSEPWKFFEGRWWAQREGEWVWLDETRNQWIEVAPAVPPTP